MGTESLAKQYADYGSVNLCRETYHQASKQVHNPEVKVILSTDIAECGFNCDLDTVISTSKTFKFFANDEAIYGQVVTVNRASHIQRRGRVGRKKPGYHLFMHQPVTGHSIEAEDLDAAAMVMASGMMEPKYPVFHGIVPSVKQVLASIERGISPYTAVILYDTSGVPRTDAALDSVFKSLMAKAPIKGCDEESCPCSKFEWFDIRDHDLVVQNFQQKKVARPRNPPVGL